MIRAYIWSLVELVTVALFVGTLALWAGILTKAI